MMKKTVTIKKEAPYEKTKWIDKDELVNYKESNQTVIRTKETKNMLISYINDIFKRNMEFRSDKSKRQTKYDYVKFTISDLSFT